MRKAPSSGPILPFPHLRMELVVRIDSFRAWLIRDRFACRAVYWESVCFRRYNAQPNCRPSPRMGMVQCWSHADRKSMTVPCLGRKNNLCVRNTNCPPDVTSPVQLQPSSQWRNVSRKVCNHFFSPSTRLIMFKINKSCKEHSPSKNQEITELHKSLSICGVDW